MKQLNNNDNQRSHGSKFYRRQPHAHLSFFILLIWLVLAPGFLRAETLSKNKVLKIKLKKGESQNCPSYSDGYRGYSCEYHFYCRGNECSTKENTFDKKHALIQLTNSKGMLEKIIPDTCPEESTGNPDLCQTEVCYDDTECLSQRCVNRTCLVNDEEPVIECMNSVHYSSLKFKYTSKMYCGKSNYEKCLTNDDCASKNCTDEGYCLYTYTDRVYDQVFYQFFEIGAIVFGCLFTIFLISCLSCYMKHKKRTKISKNIV